MTSPMFIMLYKFLLKFNCFSWPPAFFVRIRCYRMPLCGIWISNRIRRTHNNGSFSSDCRHRLVSIVLVTFDSLSNEHRFVFDFLARCFPNFRSYSFPIPAQPCNCGVHLRPLVAHSFFSRCNVRHMIQMCGLLTFLLGPLMDF